MVLFCDFVGVSRSFLVFVVLTSPSALLVRVGAFRSLGVLGVAMADGDDTTEIASSDAEEDIVLVVRRKPSALLVRVGVFLILAVRGLGLAND